MPQLRLKDVTYELPAGETRIGRGEGEHAAIDLAGAGPQGILAVIDRGNDGAVLVRRGPDSAAVEVNGLALGAEPVPLMHGDRLGIDGHTLRFGDDASAFKTAFIPLAPDDVLGRRGPERRKAPSTGGRLVSQVDGREYGIGERLCLGREASNDVVLTSADVSRRHAEIVLGANGYEIRDLSSNGVFVNGERARSGRTLVRGDVLRLGREELRFHADAVAVPSPAAATSGVSSPRTEAPRAEPAERTPQLPAARTSLVLWVTMLAVAAIVLFYLFEGR